MKIAASAEEIMIAAGFPKGPLMMERFCRAVKSGTPLDTETLLFFTTAFKAIKDGVNIKKALELERLRGRHSKKDSDRSYDIISNYAQVRLSGKGYNKAIEKVAEGLGLNEKTVQRHIKRHAAEIEVGIAIQEEWAPFLRNAMQNLTKKAARSSRKPTRRQSRQ